MAICPVIAGREQGRENVSLGLSGGGLMAAGALGAPTLWTGLDFNKRERERVYTHLAVLGSKGHKNNSLLSGERREEARMPLPICLCLFMCFFKSGFTLSCCSHNAERLERGGGATWVR